MRGASVEGDVTQPSDPQGRGAPLHEKEASLRELLRGLGSVIIAYSGGVDSACLLKVAYDELGERAVGVTAVSPSLAPWELEEARAIAQQIGARVIELETDELSREGYRANAGDRCYHCKAELFDVTSLALKTHELEGALCYGAITDDLGDHRPGMDAARDRGVRAPLLEVGLSKEDVRALAKRLDLPVWDKPAAACLSSRFPFGTEVTASRLQQVARCESGVRALGLREVRARYHDSLVRLELGQPELQALFTSQSLRAQVTQACKQAGFTFVSIDLDGYRSGSAHEALIQIKG